MQCDVVFFFKQKTAYEMRISDWSSDVCSSDLTLGQAHSFVHTLANIYPALRHGLHAANTRAGMTKKTNQLIKDIRLILIGNAEIGRASCRERVCQYV